MRPESFEAKESLRREPVLGEPDTAGDGFGHVPGALCGCGRVRWLVGEVSVHEAANRMAYFEGVRPIFRSYRTLQISLSTRKMRQTPGA
jgi:hypothetical protein